jgi:hypothetical protein
MIDLIRQILAELPHRRERSSLEPYRELVLEMRRLGYSYREMARLLADRCGVKISHAAVHNFVRRHTRRLAAEPPHARPEVGMGRRAEARGANARELGDVRDRIAALKRRTSSSGTMDEPDFRFDPDKPLRFDDEQS